MGPPPDFALQNLEIPITKLQITKVWNLDFVIWDFLCEAKMGV